MNIDEKLLDEVCREIHNDISEWHGYERYSIQGKFIFVYYTFMGLNEDLKMKMVKLEDYIQIHRESQLQKLI
jgi:hypothetical protein